MLSIWVKRWKMRGNRLHQLSKRDHKPISTSHKMQRILDITVAKFIRVVMSVVGNH